VSWSINNYTVSVGAQGCKRAASAVTSARPFRRSYFAAFAATVGLRIGKSIFFCIVYLRPEMKIIATNSMPKVVSDLL
jgi:hypothetical protein